MFKLRRPNVCPFLAAVFMLRFSCACWAQGNSGSAAPIEADVAGRTWEREAVQHLLNFDESGVFSPVEPFRLYGGKGLRCVRLKNYWCLKQRKGGWPKTIGADSDGHANFAQPVNGAAAAINLIRDYYCLLAELSG